jgi:hypothetical protein
VTLGARERGVLEFCSVHPLVLGWQGVEMFGADWEMASETLLDDGLIASYRLAAGWPEVFQVTSAGLTGLGSALPVPEFDPVDVRRALFAVAFWMSYEKSKARADSPVGALWSRRQLQAGVCEPVDRVGVRFVGDRGVRWLISDVLLETMGDHRMVVFFDVEPRPSGELRALLSFLGSDPRLQSVVFYVPDAYSASLVRGISREVGISAMVDVRPLVEPTSRDVG